MLHAEVPSVGRTLIIAAIDDITVGRLRSVDRNDSSGCPVSDSSFHSCSVWKVFHSVSVEVVDQGRLRNKSESLDVRVMVFKEEFNSFLI